MHFHDTRGTALANVYAALRNGIAKFDSSAGGLGGCPYAPGATGNVGTEDVLYLLDTMGIETGVDSRKSARPRASSPMSSATRSQAKPTRQWKPQERCHPKAG